MSPPARHRGSKRLCAAAIVALAAVSSAGAAARDSVRVDVSGSGPISVARVRTWVLGKGGIARVAGGYAARGYWSAVVADSAGRDAAGDSVRWVRIDRGPRASIEPVGSPGALNSPSDVPVWVRQVLESSANDGHPFAALDLVAVREPKRGEYRLETRLEPGPLVHIGRVLATGNTVTRQYVIARELRQPPGAPYNRRRVEQWRARLLRTGYFEYVGQPGLVWSDSAAGIADLVIPVTEGRPNQFQGVVGYQPGQAGTKGTFTGLVDLTLGNLWGTGRELHVQWNRPQPSSTTLDLMYREPWVAGYPVDASGELAVQQRPGYATEDVSLGASGEIVPDLTVSGTVGRDIVRSDSVLLLGGPRSRSYTVGASVDYDTRDVPENPTHGARYQFTWQYSFVTNRVSDPDFLRWFDPTAWPAKERTSHVRLDLEQYVPLASRVVLAVAWHGAEVTSGSGRSTFSDAEQIRLGGALTLRGYEEDQFLGDRAVWGNHELRYRLGTSSRVFVFLDAGGIRSTQFDPTSGATVSHTYWPVGYGIGLRSQTQAGLLGIDFGWGRGDSFGQGKVHVTLETQF